MGQGSDEVTEVPVPVLAETPAATGLSCVATRVLAGRGGPRASLDRVVGTNQEIWRGEPKNRGESSVPGLADWLLGVVAALPPAVRLARSCSGAPVVDA